METAIGQAPLFPLPHGALLPGELLPLRVFEPRYRRMLEVVRDRDRILAIATLAPGWESDYDGNPPIRPVVGVGRVIKDRLNADGTSDITVHGLMRAVVSDELQDEEPFRQAAVVLHPEQDGHPVESFREARRLLECLARVVRNRRFHYDLTQPIRVGSLADRIAGGLDLQPEQRVGVFQALETTARVTCLLDIMREHRHRARLLELIPSLTNFSLQFEER